MWVLTPMGFYSAVQKRGTTDITIRGRNRADLERLLPLLPQGSEIIGDAGTDYTWRIAGITHEEWAQALARMAIDIDYSNFKDEVKKKRGFQYAQVLAQVWTVLLRLEDRPSRTRWSSGSFSDELDLFPRSAGVQPAGSKKAKKKSASAPAVQAGKRGRGRG